MKRANKRKKKKPTALIAAGASMCDTWPSTVPDIVVL
jgi:hypothetical protein